MLRGAGGFPYLEITNFLFLLFLGFEIYQIALSRSLEDIDLISKNFKIVFNGSSSLFRRAPFRACSFLSFPNVEIYTNNI